MASYKDIFARNDLDLKSNIIDAIRGIINFRYKQMIDGPSKDVYISTFFLDPRKYLLKLR